MSLPNEYTTDLEIFGTLRRALSDPPTGVLAITPSDSTPLPRLIRAFEVTAAGDVNAKFIDGSSGVLPARQVGPRYSGIVTQIFATGTTATGIIGYA